MGQDSQFGSGGDRESLVSRTLGWSALAATLVSFAWFCSRLSPGLAAGPWQGALLDQRPINDLPSVTWLFVRVMARLRMGVSGWSLNVASAVFGALACGAVAALAAAALSRVCSPRRAVICAVLGTLLFATSAPLVRASTAAGPATLTTFLALAALLSLSVARDSEQNLIWIGLSALAAGLTTANHASFALLFFIIVGATLLFDLVPDARVTSILLIVIGFVAGASLPGLRAVSAGEPLASFLHHGLRTPYPTVGDGRPDLGFFRAVVANRDFAVLLLALTGFVLVFKRDTRDHGVIGLLALLCFGPLLPCLTNHYGAEYGLQDTLAPRILVAAMIAVFAAWGLAVLSDLVSDRAAPLRVSASALGLLLVVALLFHQAANAPDRRQPFASRAAKEILEACPENSLLICNDSDASCFLKGAQYVDGTRPDVLIFSLDTLLDSRLRSRFAEAVQGTITFAAVFDPQTRLDAYGVEQPFLLQDISRKSAASPLSDANLASLAIWDLARDNAAQRPICFAGVSTPWLTGRARQQDCILVYPQSTPAPTEPSDRELVSLCELLRSSHDPDLARAVQNIVLSLSDGARNRGDAPKAFELAELALGLDDRNPAAYRALSRSEARQGRSEQAQRHAQAFSKLAPASGKADELRADLDDDAQLRSLEAQFQDSFEAGPDDSAAQTRKDAVVQLWQADQLETLNQGYKKILARMPNNVEALYEQAAILAQLGDVAQAGRILERWRVAGNYSDEGLKMRINLDGRFALIYLPERRAEEADTNAYIRSMTTPAP